MMRDPYPILEFERGDDPAGVLIPMSMRMKLDLAGCRISLDDWQALPPANRHELRAGVVDTELGLTEFKRKLNNALRAANRNQPLPLPDFELMEIRLWKDHCQIPTVVSQIAEQLNVQLDWPSLDMFARYAFWSLARKGRAQRFLSVHKHFCGTESVLRS